MRTKITLGFEGELDGYDQNQVIAMTFAAAKFNEIQVRGGTLSNKFGLAKTANNKRVMGLLDDIQSQGDEAYVTHNCKIEVDGLPVFYGIATIDESSTKYFLRIFASAAGFFARIGESTINEVDLSIHDFDLNLANISSKRGAFAPVVFPNINYGLWTGESVGAQDWPDFFPAVRLTTILDTVAPAFTITGIDSDRYILAALERLQANNSVPCNAASTVIQELIVAPATTNAEDIYFDDIINNRNAFIDFDTTLGVSATFINFGISGSQKGAIITTTFDWFRDGSNGAAGLVVELASSGTVFASDVMPPSDSGTITLTGTVSTTTSPIIQVTISGTNGDSVDILSGATFEVLEGEIELRPGNNLPIEDQLPDLSIKDVFLEEAVRKNALIIVDEEAKTVKLIPLNDIAAKQFQAVDWSEKISLVREPKFTFRNRAYAQSNKILWKEGNEDFDVSDIIGLEFGGGVISVADGNLLLFKTLYESLYIFSARLEAFLTQPLMLRVIRFSTTSLSNVEGDVEPGPRIVKLTLDTTHLIAISGAAAVSPQLNATMDTWQDEIDEFYVAFQSIFDKYKHLEIPIRLNAIDIQELDFTVPVFLLKEYWYLQEIKQWKANKEGPTIVKLLRL